MFHCKICIVEWYNCFSFLFQNRKKTLFRFCSKTKQEMQLKVWTHFIQWFTFFQADSTYIHYFLQSWSGEVHEWIRVDNQERHVTHGFLNWWLMGNSKYWFLSDIITVFDLTTVPQHLIAGDTTFARREFATRVHVHENYFYPEFSSRYRNIQRNREDHDTLFAPTTWPKKKTDLNSGSIRHLFVHYHLGSYQEIILKSIRVVSE